MCLNASVGGRTVPLKGFLIWNSCEDVLCTLEHLRRDRWGKAGYLSYSSGTQSGQQDCHSPQLNLSHHILLGDWQQRDRNPPKKSYSRVLGHCHTYTNPSGHSRGQAQGGWPSGSTLPSSHLSNRTEGLQSAFLPGQKHFWSEQRAYSCSLPDNKHLDSPRRTERTLQGNQLLFMHILKYILFSYASLPALFREVSIVSGFSLPLCTR